MANTYTPPIISVAFDMDEGLHVLMATSHSHTAIAGERIFRAEPHPSIKFRHEREEDANRDAGVLRSYLEECATGKIKEGAPVGRGWWQ